MRTLFVAVSGSLLALTACAVGTGSQPQTPSVEGGREGRALTLVDQSGREVARAQVGERDSGVRVDVTAAGLAPGSYGMHVHAVGRCDAPDFTSAGPHWNPTGRQHGRDNPAGAHQGDLPNLMVGTDRRGSVGFDIPQASLTGGPAPIVDADGATLMIHAAADDYRTDRSGNSGARIACGIIR